MDKAKKELSNEDLKPLKKVIKKYTNYYKALYQLNPSAADEFKKKQEHFYNIKCKEKEHQGCQHENKLETKSNFYILITMINSLYTTGRNE